MTITMRKSLTRFSLNHGKQEILLLDISCAKSNLPKKILLLDTTAWLVTIVNAFLKKQIMHVVTNICYRRKQSIWCHIWWFCLGFNICIDHWGAVVVVLSQCNKEMSVGHSNFQTSWPYYQTTIQRPDGVCNVPFNLFTWY